MLAANSQFCVVWAGNDSLKFLYCRQHCNPVIPCARILNSLRGIPSPLKFAVVTNDVKGALGFAAINFCDLISQTDWDYESL